MSRASPLATTAGPRRPAYVVQPTKPTTPGRHRVSPDVVPSSSDGRRRRPGIGRGRPAVGRAEGLVRAPVAEPPRAGPELALVLGLGDRGPQRLELALCREQVGLVGGVAEHLAVAE